MLVLLPMITLRSRCNEACTSHGNHACHAPGGLRELRRRTDPALLPCLLLRKLDCRFGLLAFVSARRGRIGQEAEVACSFPVWFSSSDKQRVAFDQQRRRRLFALCQRNRISSSSSSSSSSSIQARMECLRLGSGNGGRGIRDGSVDTGPGSAPLTMLEQRELRLLGGE